MPKNVSVNNFCEGMIEGFIYKSVDTVLAIIQPHDYMAVVDISQLNEQFQYFQTTLSIWVSDGI